MYCKIIWCYIFVFILLDISLNTKLSAQGKSHGITVHDSLMEGVSFQEWGKESVAEASGGVLPPDTLRVSPPSLSLGRSSLAAPRASLVTLTNAANTTMHLASVAGTTPDFHASFFDSKTLPPQGNTSFSVVYLGRREGPVSAHLYIHTSLGVHKYPVSAEGVASEYGVWPLVGVRVPYNATVEPVLTMYNPTDQTIQVQEVYSSAPWLGLRLPGGGESASRDLWALPPRTARALVRLRMRMQHTSPPPAGAGAHHALTAYIRIKANITGPPLVVVVEARSTPAGEYASPLQLRPGARGSRDPTAEFDIELGNSLDESVSVDASVWGARCDSRPLAPPPDVPAARSHAAYANGDTTMINGGSTSEGARVTLLRTHLAPHQELMPAARLKLDYEKLWNSFAGSSGGDAKEAWCAGWVRLGRASVPYSVRLLPGTLEFQPAVIDFVTADEDTVVREREVRVRNHFPEPVLAYNVHYTPEAGKYFEVVESTPTVLPPGGEATVARIRLRADAPPHALDSSLTVLTNLTDYTAPLRVYSGRLHFEWDWPNTSGEDLDLGVVGTSSTRRVGARLQNPAPAALCVTALSAAMPGARLALAACDQLGDVPAEHPCRCIDGYGAGEAWLTVVAPAREGPLRGTLEVRTQHARAQAAVTLRAHTGRIRAHSLKLDDAAPYAWSSASLVLESSMALRMHLLNVTQAVPQLDPTLTYVPPPSLSSLDIEKGTNDMGQIVYAPERECEPSCYTGLDINSLHGKAWLGRSYAVRSDTAVLKEDLALLVERVNMYEKLTDHVRNVTLYVHTTQVVQIPVNGWARQRWPRLVVNGANGATGTNVGALAGVGGAVPVRVRVRNPAPARSLLLQPVLEKRLTMPDIAYEELQFCNSEGETDDCVWSYDAFTFNGWRATRGGVGEWPRPSADAGGENTTTPLLILEPDAEVELTFMFSPKKPLALTSYLYLRNNLTILEGVQLVGRGAYPSFELAGRRPGSAPLVLEVHECPSGMGSAQISLTARNTGRVPVTLREWRIAGHPCAARGFRVRPCAPLHLAPNHTKPLHLQYTADFTLSRTRAVLSMNTDLGLAEFPLVGLTPAVLLGACANVSSRPLFEPALRAAGTLLALTAIALILGAAAIDAERLLRKARNSRSLAPPRPPLDLRGVAHDPIPSIPRPLPTINRKKKPPRRSLPPLDPHAERRAFERWRAEVLRRDAPSRAEDESSRSSEEPDAVTTESVVTELPNERLVTNEDSVTPPDEYETEVDPEHPRTSGDEDAASTGTESSRDEPENDDRDEPEPPHTHINNTETNNPPEPVKNTPQTDTVVKVTKPRREASETPRRIERTRPSESGEGISRPRPNSSKHARKDKPGRRRDKPVVTPPRASPPRPVENKPCGGGVRWGATFSSVVAARGGPLPPIGSDVRRRTDPEPMPRPRTDNSLFYFNGDAAHATPASPPVQPHPDTEYAWCSSQPDRSAFVTPTHDYLEDSSNGGYGSIGSVWGAPTAAAWLWGGYNASHAHAGVRPPPGFSGRGTNVGVPGANVGVPGASVGVPGAGVGVPRAGVGVPGAVGVRAYDPFHSLASIWAPGALDWRPDQQRENENNN